VDPDRLPRRERAAVRVILLDPQQRILLLRGQDPALPDSPAWWFTPGGGVRGGEDPLAALRRECWEELGFVPRRFTGPLAHRRYEFAFDDHWLVQDTDYYAAAVRPFRPAPQRLTSLEQRFLLGWRWWPLPKVAAADETIYPDDLADLAEAARRAAPTG
jgi:8-oxo-dGTP pyrophosphatase MutT (NUDIX family)